MKKLNLGSGEDYRKGYINVDLYCKSDLKLDLNILPYPFENNSFEEVLAYNIIEHLKDPYEVLMEIHRICKNKAGIYIQVPHFTSGNAWADIQHKRPFSLKSFSNPNMKPYFKVIKCEVRGLFGFIGNAFPRLWEYLLCFMLPSGDMFVELEVIKNGEI